MDYEQFVAEFTAELQQNMEQENVELRRGTVRKVNEELDGITVKYPDSDVAPTIYLEDKYELVQEGSYSVEQVAEKTANQLKSIRDDAPEVPILTEEAARQNLYCVVINASENEELLRNVPHERLEDLAVIPRFKVGDNASFIVTNAVCSSLKMTSEEVMEAAHINTNKQEFRCQNMTEVLCEIMKEHGLPDEYIDEVVNMQGRDCPMYVVSNESRVDGAAALTSTAALDSAYSQIKEDHPGMKDLYVLGSSRHELILVPDDTVANVEELKTIHKEVQDTELSKADKLTEHVYKFDAKSKQISIADSLSLTNGESMAMEAVKSHSRLH